MKTILAQNSDYSAIINFLRQRNFSASQGDIENTKKLQIEIDKIFKKYDLTGNKNLKLQQLKFIIDSGFNQVLNIATKAKEKGQRGSLEFSIPFNDIDAFATKLYNDAIAYSKSTKPEEIGQQIILMLEAEYSDLLLNPVIKENLFNALKTVAKIDFNALPSEKETQQVTVKSKQTQDPARLSERDRLTFFINSANKAAESGDLQKVQVLQFEVEKLFKNQLDMWAGKNPKLKNTYDRLLAHFRELKAFAVKKAKNPKYNELYKFDKSNIGQSPDESVEKLAKKIVDNAKAQLIKSDNLGDLKNRIEIIITTGHRKILENPLLKKLLYDEIKKLTSTPSNVGGIDLNKQASLLKNMIKVANSLENKNYLNEADRLNKILIDLTSIINSR